MSADILSLHPQCKQSDDPTPGQVIPFLGKPKPSKPKRLSAEMQRYGRLIVKHAAQHGISVTINGPLEGGAA